MGIANTIPPDWSAADAVQVDSTAADNMAAIGEIDDWAAAHGFERVNEYWLRQRQAADGRRVFRGVCIRLTPAEVAARGEENDTLAASVDRMAPAVRHAAGAGVGPMSERRVVPDNSVLIAAFFRETLVVDGHPSSTCRPGPGPWLTRSAWATSRRSRPTPCTSSSSRWPTARPARRGRPASCPTTS